MNRYKKKILASCSYGAVSAKELSAIHELPIGSCYRLIRVLLSEGALKCTLAVSKEGVVPLFKVGSFKEPSVSAENILRMKH